MVYCYLVGLVHRYSHRPKLFAMGSDAVGIQVRRRDDQENTLLLHPREEILGLKHVAE